MKKTNVILLVVLCCFTTTVLAQAYDIVIKGGHVIDPKNNIDAVMDIALKDGKIEKIGGAIDTKQAIQTIDAKEIGRAHV